MSRNPSSRFVRRAVYTAVNGAVYETVDETVEDAVHGAVDGAVARAVSRAVFDPVYWTVARAVRSGPPHSNLDRFSAEVRRVRGVATWTSS